MTSTSGARSCPSCGGTNYGTRPACILCDAPMRAESGSGSKPKQAFCGECGMTLEAGATFCGECGSPVTAAPLQAQQVPSREPSSPDRPLRKVLPAKPPRPSKPSDSSASRWAPPPVASAPGASSQPPPKKRFCRGCGTELKPEARFCRKCGTAVDRPAALPRPLAPKPVPATRPAAPKPPAPQPAPAKRPAPPPVRPIAPRPVAAKQESTGAGWGKKTLRVIVPVTSMVVTYFLTNKVLGPMLAQQFGDASRQMVPMLVSMAVGGVARQLTK